MRTTPETNRLNEFSLIKQYFCSGFPLDSSTLLGAGDDASSVSPPAHAEIIQSIDTQVAGVHFPAQAPAELIAQRALRCAASDLAAMGATPQGFHLALTLPSAEQPWLESFASGLKQASHELNLALLGGDTTRGEQLVISISVQGWIQSNRERDHQISVALLRSGAQAGDDVWLSGPVGAATLALPTILKKPATTDGFAKYYYFPTVHFELGQALLGTANSCIDISDGLLQDAEHIANASHVSFELNLDAVQTVASYEKNREQWWQCLTGGDDYQLLFTLDANSKYIQELRQRFPNLHKIGTVKPKQKEGYIQIAEQYQSLANSHSAGFQHF